MDSSVLCRCHRCGQQGQRLDAETHRMHATAQALEQAFLGESSSSTTTATPDSTGADLDVFAAAGRRLVGDIFLQLETVENHRATLHSLNAVHFDVAALGLLTTGSTPPTLDPDADSNIAYFHHQDALIQLRRTVDRLDATESYLRPTIDTLKTEIQEAIQRHAGLEEKAVALRSAQRMQYLADGMDAPIVPPRKHFTLAIDLQLSP